jgi:hypothetical protein
VTGIGVQANVVFSAPAPVLTSTPANTTAKKATITVRNTGSGPLKLSAAPTITKTAGAAASQFAITGGTCASAVVVAAGGTCTISIRYTPANAVISTAHVTLRDIGAAAATQNSANFNGN